MKRAILLLVAATAVSMHAHAQQRHHLLYDALATPNHPSTRVPSLRSRAVQADVGFLKPNNVNRGQKKRLERLLSVALFSDVRLQVVLDELERTAIDSYAWTGRVEGDTRSSVIVAVKDEAISATFTTSARKYELRPVAGGLHEVHEVDHSAFPDESEPGIALANAIPPGTAAQPEAAADGETLVDLLIAYTHVVREGLGSTSAAQTLATNIVTTTNSAYANSGVSMRVRLVGTVEYQYDDRLTDFSTTLSRFTSTSDGHMDDVHTLRNQLGADAVGLLVYLPTDTTTCGIGWLMTNPNVNFAQYGFNVTRDDCAAAALSFAHELGHNFGLAHNRSNATNASRTYAYGYQNPQALFRTVMAYNCPTVNGCPRVAHFSNPNVLYNGAPTGINHLLSDAADNARALNENRSYIAQWRSLVVPIPVTFTDQPLTAGIAAKAIHVTELRSAINTLRAAKGLSAATWTTSVASAGAITAAQITELRNALAPAVSPVVPIYTDATLAANMPIKAVHIQELRNYVD